ncbi:hypothetical protein MRB53_038737 [Persea americana]|nr:hypothetical protein MRB53_038737 [Persea americana]
MARERLAIGRMSWDLDCNNLQKVQAFLLKSCDGRDQDLRRKHENQARCCQRDTAISALGPSRHPLYLEKCITVTSRNEYSLVIISLMPTKMVKLRSS